MTPYTYKQMLLLFHMLYLRSLAQDESFGEGVRELHCNGRIYLSFDRRQKRAALVPVFLHQFRVGLLQVRLAFRGSEI